MKFYKTVCLLAAAFFALVPFSINTLAETYKAEGQMTYTAINSEGNLENQGNFVFTIWVDGCKWNIQTSIEGRKDIKAFQDSYDGTFVYNLTTFIDKAGKDRPSGIIESNNIPHESSFYASPVWLALASSCYFNDITNNMFQPIWHLNDISIRNKRFSVNGKLTVHGTAPFLPEKVLYYNDGKIYLRNSHGNSTSANYPSPYDKGFIEAEYIALDFTNKYGVDLPQRFTFTRYMPRSGGQSTNETAILCIYNGVVTNISISSDKKEFAPRLSPPVYVDDRRFGVATASVTSIQYRVTNIFWPSMENPVVSNLYKMNVLGAGKFDDSQSNTQKRFPKIIIWGAFLCSTIFFVFLIFKGTNRETKKTNK